MIRKVGSQYKLYTKDGSKVLGTHPSHKAAVEQEQAIEASKSRLHKAIKGDISLKK